MARYSVAHAKAGINTANSPMWALRAVTNRGYLLELGLSVAVAPTTGPDFIVYRTTAAAVTPVSSTPQPEGSLAPTSTTLLDTSWATAPTFGATPLRRYAVPNAIGSGVVWTWYDKPLEIEPVAGGGLVIVNGNATSTTLGTLDIYAVLDG